MKRGNYKVETDFPYGDSSAQYKVRRFLSFIFYTFLVKFHFIIGFHLPDIFMQVLHDDVKVQFDFWSEVWLVKYYY